MKASTAASSASGESGIVSNDEMLGLRERSEVGVLGIDEVAERAGGKDSLYLVGVGGGAACDGEPYLKGGVGDGDVDGAAAGRGW